MGRDFTYFNSLEQSDIMAALLTFVTTLNDSQSIAQSYQW